MSAVLRVGLTALISGSARMASSPALASCQFLTPVAGHGQSNIVTKTINLGSPLPFSRPN